MSEPSAVKKLADLEAEIAEKSAFLDTFFAEMAKKVVGQRDLLEALLIGRLCQGHVLIEGVPGLAKTLTANTMAAVLGLSFRRIQFTPDLLPSDLLGTPVYHPGKGEFNTRKGPIFAHLVLADEINRAPAKVQSALLEAMEECQVTLGDTTYPLPNPFLVIATQNPLEHEGTYPLPEAQVDRFMIKVRIDYPTRDEEEKILELGEPSTPVQPVIAPEQLAAAIEAIGELHMDTRVRGYILDIVAATREPASFGLTDLVPLVEHGASPRGSIFLARAARAYAFLQRRPYVVPDDVLTIAPLILRHRLHPSFEAEAQGIYAEELLQRILDAVPAP